MRHKFDNKQYLRLFSFLKNWKTHGLESDWVMQDLGSEEKKKLGVPPETVFEFFCLENKMAQKEIQTEEKQQGEIEKLVQNFKNLSENQRINYKNLWLKIWEEFRTKFEKILLTNNEFIKDNPLLEEDLDESDLPIWLFYNEKEMSNYLVEDWGYRYINFGFEIRPIKGKEINYFVECDEYDDVDPIKTHPIQKIKEYFCYLVPYVEDYLSFSEENTIFSTSNNNKKIIEKHTQRKKSIPNPFKTKPEFQFNFFEELFNDFDDLNYNIPFFLVMEGAKNLYFKTEPKKVLSNDLLNLFNNQKSGDFLISDFKVHSVWLKIIFSKIYHDQNVPDLDHIKTKLELLEEFQIKLFLQWLYCGNVKILIENKEEGEKEKKNEKENEQQQKEKEEEDDDEEENNEEEPIDYDEYIKIKEKKEEKIKRKEKILDGILKRLGIKQTIKEIETNWTENLKQLEKDSKFKDFSIEISNQLNMKETETISIHRFILEARSRLYKELFEITENENITSVKDYSKKSFRFWTIFVHYLYTSEMGNLDDENLQIQDLVQESEYVGDYFQLSKPSLFLRLIYHKTNNDLKMKWIESKKEVEPEQEQESGNIKK
ncbi:heat shock protein [Anaeramoeba flamelloides]|uniref:Heat shock protein n=1 Tax=Anaeramoeba flamelloides TaxID=1746091 RepID=A0AAV7YU86_9EUKA|nr:heat shock protein [Anaeramoeba flamelloides]